MRAMAAPASEADIWDRVIMSESHELSPDAARALLKLGFTDTDKDRMNELARKNQEGTLSATERQELECWVNVGDTLALLHLKAHKSLKGKRRRSGGKDG